MTFSIIIPSYNEGDDIRLSVESALAQTVPPLEILVVDDSTDRTPDVVREYVARGVRLIQGEGKGCCGARNLGMRQAKGDVIVLLNADVRLPADFLARIEPHYLAGADYVLVESEVLNQDRAFAAFLQAQDMANYGSRTDLEWTEGFSARRSALEAVGYIPGDFKVRFCRDWMLGRALGQAGFKKVIDRSIVVTHKAPADPGEYWRFREVRGRFAALSQRYMYKKGRASLAVKFAAKQMFRLLLLITLVHPSMRAVRLARRSAHPFRNIIPFFAAHVIQEVARAVGEWRGLLAMR